MKYINFYCCIFISPYNNMDKDYGYPETDDEDIQYKLFKKREFYYHKIPDRPIMNNYGELEKYRKETCHGQAGLQEHQISMSNFINPDTPYRGILCMHGVGSGKCLEKNMLVMTRAGTYPIEYLWDSNVTTIICDNEGEWTVPKQPIMVYSMYEGKLQEYPVSHLYRERINSSIKIVRLLNNKTIRITYSHKLYTSTGWSNQLEIGNRVMCYEKGVLTFSPITSVGYKEYNNYVYDLDVYPYHNYIAEDIVCHNTCVGIGIAEKFKSVVQKYNTKIYVLVPRPVIKETWKRHLLICTGNTYKNPLLRENKIDTQRAMNEAMQYYKFISYRSFYKRVLGERISTKQVITGEKSKVIYKKTEEGEFERDISVDRIDNLNNTLIIVDEAHGLTNNNYGDALKYIIRKSTNLKVVLLSGTPMKNTADEIVELVNFLRPESSQIDRNLVFNTSQRHLLDFKPGGMEYLRDMLKGYVSHVKGGDPYIFATRRDKGKVPNGLLFTKVTRCMMSEFQLQVFKESISSTDDYTIDDAQTPHEHRSKKFNDNFDRQSESVSNFVFPGLTTNRKEITGYHGLDGLSTIKRQIVHDYDALNNKISKLLSSDDLPFITFKPDGKTITGNIFKNKYLGTFSTKFHKALNNLERLVEGQKGPQTAFIYSNLVKVGIDVFQEVLLQNGYLEYQDNTSYYVQPTTKCYYCGKTQREHRKVSEGGSDGGSNVISTSDHHTFHPATFLTVTGAASDEAEEIVADDKRKLIDDVFNSVENRQGKLIKFILGSQVINEGVSLFNVGQVHILDVYFNLGRVEQVIGRAIRWCSHMDVMNEEDPYPYVDVYKYVVGLEDGLSAEEELYRKAELKHVLIKKVERMMKEVAIDCPLNINGNIFREDVEKYKDCKPGECPPTCDYTNCEFKCDNVILNAELYDPERKIYKSIPKGQIDYSTYTYNFAKSDIDYAKNRIKEMFITKFIYTLEDIIEYVKNSYSDDKREMFDDFFVHKALTDMIPTSKDEVNDLTDTIIDKFGRQGYLLYIDRYYVFQPFNQGEEISMYYRSTYAVDVFNNVSLYNYIIHDERFKQSKENRTMETTGKSNLAKTYYNFKDTVTYYDSRDEFDFVGCVDRDTSTGEDVFKIRERRNKVLEKKRGTGIPSLYGAVCSIAKNKQYLFKVINKLNMKVDKHAVSRTVICEQIREKMLHLEKTSTGKNKKTYVIIPSNHPEYPFPYNLEDRVEYIEKQFDEQYGDVKTSVQKKNESYTITIQDTPKFKDNDKLLKKYDAMKKNSVWEIIVK